MPLTLSQKSHLYVAILIEVNIHHISKKKVGETWQQFNINFLMHFVLGVNLAEENTGYPLSNSLVMFITGRTVLDPQEDLEVAFQTNTRRKLLKADSCFRKVILPISHSCYEESKAACNLSLLSGAVGYGTF